MESLLDRMQAQKVENVAEKYLRRYRPYVEVLESHSLLSKTRAITPYDIYAMGLQLDAFQAYKQMCEDDGTIASLGVIPNIALDVVAAMYGTSPLSAIASVQPIDEERGTVYYKAILAMSTRGGTIQGQSIFDSAAQMPQTILRNYASSAAQLVVGPQVAPATSYNYPTQLAAAGYLPLRPGKVAVVLKPSGPGPTGQQPLHAADYNMDGCLLGAGIWGTVDYQTGELNLTLSDPPAGPCDVVAIIDQVMEGAPDIPRINYVLQSKAVVANLFALKDTVGLEQSYAMRRRFGMIAEDEMTKDLVASINSEIVNTLVINLLMSVPPTNQAVFDYTPPNATSYLENKQHLKDIISATEANILKSANRGNITVLIAGAGACSVISTLPGWVRLSDGASMGPHIFGTLDGTVVVRIPNPAVLASNLILTLYKGPAPFDGACVYAPYMPLVVTTALPIGTNPLMQQKAAAVWAAVEVLLPNFIGLITIQNSPA